MIFRIKSKSKIHKLELVKARTIHGAAGCVRERKSEKTESSDSTAKVPLGLVVDDGTWMCARVWLLLLISNILWETGHCKSLVVNYVDQKEEIIAEKMGLCLNETKSTMKGITHWFMANATVMSLQQNKGKVGIYSFYSTKGPQKTILSSLQFQQNSNFHCLST